MNKSTSHVVNSSFLYFLVKILPTFLFNELLFEKISAVFTFEQVFVQTNDTHFPYE
jgi:hypothetical protein